MYISRPFPPGRQCSSSPATARKISRVFLQACLNNQHFPPFYISNATINMTSTLNEAQERAIIFARNFVDSLTEEVSNIFHHNSKVLTFFRAHITLPSCQPLGCYHQHNYEDYGGFPNISQTHHHREPDRCLSP